MPRPIPYLALTAEQRAQALAKLRALAQAKARYDGTVLPYAWPARVAPRLGYTLAGGGVWDCQPLPAERQAGWSLFTLPLTP